MSIANAQTTPAVPDEDTILQDASEALQERERLTVALRSTDARLRVLCRLYDQAAGTRGFAPHHLAQACRARGLTRGAG